MLDRKEEDMLKAAREHLERLPVAELVTRLLATEAELKKQQRHNTEQDRDFAGLERQADATREVLWCELHDANTKGDLVSLANAARLRLSKMRGTREIPF